MNESSLYYQPAHPHQNRMWDFLSFINQQEQLTLTTYESLHLWSIKYPERFWARLADFFDLPFSKEATTVLRRGEHLWETRWFIGSTFNYAEQALKRRDNKTALIAIDEQQNRRMLSYEALFQAVCRIAHGLKKAGVQKGDRIVAIMPNIPETLIMMLAASSIGAIFSSCAPEFGLDATLQRLSPLAPKLVLATTHYRYNGKVYQAFDKIKAIKESLPSLTTLVLFAPDEADARLAADLGILWQDFGSACNTIDFERLPFDHPLYILFSSGTTGVPKCIVHGQGGTLLQHLKELALHTNLSQDDTLFFYTTCGWMMWNWMVSGLLLGLTLVLYDGAPTYPHTARLIEIADRENVTVFGAGARYLATLENQGEKPNIQYPNMALRSILSTGSPLLPTQYDYVRQHIKDNIALCSISGGTDIVSCFALGNPMLPIYKGELQCLGLGMAVAVFNAKGQPVVDECGELVCTEPFPSMPIGFWNDIDNRAYQKAYFSGFVNVWTHGDYARLTPHHSLVIYGRSDATLNPGGVRIGSAEIYRPLETISSIKDCVAVGQHDAGDERIILFIVLNEGEVLDEALRERIRSTIRRLASPRHVPAVIIQVPDIPKTLNGKTVELAVKQIIHGQEVPQKSALLNPESLDYFRDRPELMKS